MDKLRILSGIRPTGDMHLGNYFGAIRQFKKLQDENNECFYFVADIHALTTISETDVTPNIRKNSLKIIRSYLACGLDPNQSTIYCQSSIPQIPYLASLLGMFASESWLRRCTTFKEKSAKQKVVSLGLLGYPVLMASDILIVNADIVPVGHDQLQHLEMTRVLAEKFNTFYGETFKLPGAKLMDSIRIQSLHGTGKMGKSDSNTIGIFEEPKSIRKKVLSAVTDSGPEIGKEMSPEMKNIFLLMELISPKETFLEFKDLYDRGEQKFYGKLKQTLAEDMINYFAPMREKYNSKECSDDMAADILAEGAKKARETAEMTFQNVYNKFILYDKTGGF